MQKTKYLIITFFFLCANFQTYAQNNTEDLINKDALLKKAKSLVENVIDKTKPSNGNQSNKMVELLAKGEILDLNISSARILDSLFEKLRPPKVSQIKKGFELELSRKQNSASYEIPLSLHDTLQLKLLIKKANRTQMEFYFQDSLVQKFETLKAKEEINFKWISNNKGNLIINVAKKIPLNFKASGLYTISPYQKKLSVSIDNDTTENPIEEEINRIDSNFLVLLNEPIQLSGYLDLTKQHTFHKTFDIPRDSFTVLGIALKLSHKDSSLLPESFFNKFVMPEFSQNKANETAFFKPHNLKISHEFFGNCVEQPFKSKHSKSGQSLFLLQNSLCQQFELEFANQSQIYNLNFKAIALLIYKSTSFVKSQTVRKKIKPKVYVQWK
ncbi:MAG: hypothetical protein CBB99_01635 [Bacteroidetes bacterium TMED39]|nr:MAG: hypothetical protein CBB99_01635 [Bacteroidetes bacterium TMED39]|tara:strand:+ start:17754 stop:18908 length:1155 start_codon:yes stop_codon:yes gene_type:complete